MPTILQLFAATSCIGLGVTVLVRNPHRPTHRAFSIMSLNLGLWALGVAFIINARTEPQILFRLRATFIIASFIPLTYQYFASVFPAQRFDGYRWLLVTLFLGALASSASSFTPWYINEISIVPGATPEVDYGPAFLILVISVVMSMALGIPLLIRKRRFSSGIERRQLEYVIVGTITFSTLAAATNVLGPVLGLKSAQAYGPIFLVFMLGTFAYAMVRYHLLDIGFIVSNTTVHAFATAFVALTFIGTAYFIHWAFSGRAHQVDVAATLLAAVLITIVLQPIKERMQSFLGRFLLKRRYDVQQLLASVSESASQIVQLDQLLQKVASDIRDTIGVTAIRVLLVDQENPSCLVTEYASNKTRRGKVLENHAPLLTHFRAKPSPVALEEIVHSAPRGESAVVASHLAELDAYLCVPLKATSGLVGLLTLGQKTSRDIYTHTDLMAFRALASPLATAIENARLYRKLEEAYAHRARILSNMRGGVIAVDSLGQVQTVNHAATQMLGHIALGSDMNSITPRVTQVLKQTLKTRRDIPDFETFLRRPDGTEVPVMMSSSSLASSVNGPSGAMVMIYDLTAVKRLEQNVQRADRLTSIGTMAAGMAHEIKNPLVSIKTFAQLMPTRYDDAEFRTVFTDIVLHEVERIDSIVTRLLDFARPKPTQFAPHDICVVIRDVLTLVENQARKCDIIIESEFEDAYIEVFGDEQQLHQVFLNLALNAIEAMGQTNGGLLRIVASLGRMHLHHNRTAPLLDVECVEIAVHDTGCGVPQEDVERIFTPFYTTKEDGSGLGLSVVHGIVTGHGGTINVNSTPGRGTTFTITLPLAQNAVAVEGAKP